MCFLYKIPCTNSIAISLSHPAAVSMRVFSLELPDKSLTNIELSACARKLGIPHFRGVFMRDTLPRQTPHSVECGVLNLNTSSQSGMGMGMWSSQLADELHKPVRGRFQKRSMFAKQVDEIWTADLVDMSPYPRANSGYKYLLTVIDVFSKYGWIVPLKTKTGKEVAMAFQELFTDNAPPSRLWTDKDTEFYNQQVKRVLIANNVTLYSMENEEKSSVVERWNRTMKNMWKYFTANNTEIYRRSVGYDREVQ